MWKEKIALFCDAGRCWGAAHWKKICAVVICAAVLSGAAGAAEYFLFDIKGTVTRVDGKNVAVTDFLTTRVIDFSESPINPARLRQGDEVKIKRNLQGAVFSLTIRNCAENRLVIE